MYIAKIFSAARLVKKGIMPLKVKGIISMEEALKELLDKVKTSPPPWLKKAINSD